MREDRQNGLFMSIPFQIIERTPTLAEYRAICEAVGWGEVINFEAAPDSLARSLYSVVAMYEGQAVGMGRIIGDGAIFFYIQDIAVMPPYQGQGIGTAIMDALMRYIDASAPDKAFVGLFAAQRAIEFYKKYGFFIPPAEDLTGMFCVVQR
jgi:ribosomal protein S18 acetylase RimI-like enzyme